MKGDSVVQASISIASPKAQSQPAPVWRTHALLLLLLFVLSLLAYANSFRCGFALDNRFLILEDPRITAPTPGNLSLIFNQDYCYPQVVSGVYRPITTLTYLFNCHLGKPLVRPVRLEKV